GEVVPGRGRVQAGVDPAEQHLEAGGDDVRDGAGAGGGQIRGRQLWQGFSCIRARFCPSGSEKNAIHRSVVPSLWMKCGGSAIATPCAASLAYSASMSATRK